jgi:hypothetical protein
MPPRLVGKRNKKAKESFAVVLNRMAHPAVCSERKFLVPEAKVDEVASACRQAFKEMGLKIMKSEKTKDDSTDILAGEGALVPLTLRTLLYPFSLQQYVKAAQRSGVHVVTSPSKDGVIIYSCGLALDELTGKPAEYLSDDDIEEITNTLEALDFENKFLMKIKQIFPKAREA